MSLEVFAVDATAQQVGVATAQQIAQRKKETHLAFNLPYVERRMQEVNENTYERTLDLTNLFTIPNQENIEWINDTIPDRMNETDQQKKFNACMARILETDIQEIEKTLRAQDTMIQYMQEVENNLLQKAQELANEAKGILEKYTIALEKAQEEMDAANKALEKSIAKWEENYTLLIDKQLKTDNYNKLKKAYSVEQSAIPMKQSLKIHTAVQIIYDYIQNPWEKK